MAISLLRAASKQIHRLLILVYVPLFRPLPTLFLQLDLAIKVAISKYARVQIGTTLLGRRQLVPTCMACDRPFNPSGPSSGGGSKAEGSGDMRSVSRDALPLRNSDDSTIASYTSFQDGSRNSSNYNVVPFGVDQRKLDKFVFRAGFKIPKHINSPLRVGTAVAEGGYPSGYSPDDRSVESLGSTSSIGSPGGRGRPHTVAYQKKGKKRNNVLPELSSSPSSPSSLLLS